MSHDLPSPSLDQAFERIEGSILPCLAGMLDAVIEAANRPHAVSAAAFAERLHGLTAELEQLTRVIERPGLSANAAAGRAAA